MAVGTTDEREILDLIPETLLCRRRAVLPIYSNSVARLAVAFESRPPGTRESVNSAPDIGNCPETTCCQTSVSKQRPPSSPLLLLLLCSLLYVVHSQQTSIGNLLTTPATFHIQLTILGLSDNKIFSFVV